MLLSMRQVTINKSLRGVTLSVVVGAPLPEPPTRPTTRSYAPDVSLYVLVSVLSIAYVVLLNLPIQLRKVYPRQLGSVVDVAIPETSAVIACRVHCHGSQALVLMLQYGQWPYSRYAPGAQPMPASMPTIPSVSGHSRIRVVQSLHSVYII
ncbi:hypothetical protein BDV93DRAFT_555968 [Ceratobasidium sp. AG-I]|nr:hypothetical protein BDV93DRAFT_555968 [Ceratobasidium sp. AG-I]